MDGDRILATMSTTMLLSSWLIEVLGQRVTYFYDDGVRRWIAD